MPSDKQLDNYVAALWAEIGAWNSLLEALRTQRRVIVQRDIEALWASQDQVQELLGQVAGRHQHRRRAESPTLPDDVSSLRRQAEALQVQSREMLRLNHELLRDICSYLDMMREVVFPQTLPPTYRDPRALLRAGHHPPRTVSRTA